MKNGGVPIWATALCLLSIWTVRSESRDLTPSDHGLAFEKNPITSSASTERFFKGETMKTTTAAAASVVVAMPEARNATGSGRGHVDSWDRARFGLLVAGVACGVAGVARRVPLDLDRTVEMRWEGGPNKTRRVSWFFMTCSPRLGLLY
ncbi:hypothetical protein QJS10_CPA01g00557 [Acorus calamus]|uniref:Uncharacterized protein n=1 Tax=Acorus calamus TaxID=4465 RepID=A0AAV9FM03_ACOCL|nr:hypothetical protein QJS10_CPA01g00557 [Acorus calamus]